MNSRNASYSLFGWDFQINAAIYIFLNNIKDIERIRVEGKLQDIELIRRDGSKIYAQAKAVYRWDDYSNVINNLKSALQSLDEANAKEINTCDLVYVTNTPNPFRRDKSFFQGVVNVAYDNLPDKCKIVINKILRDTNLSSLDVNRLKICIIPFHTDDLNTRYKVIKGQVNEFLAALGLSESGFAPVLLSVWQNEVFKNGTIPDTDVSIKKSQLVWPLIFLVTDNASDDWLMNDLDEAYFEDIKAKYRTLINNVTDQFDIYTKIVYDYEHNKGAGNLRENIRDFINAFWEGYSDKFGLNAAVPKDEQECLMKLIIHKVLVKKEKIATIKKGVGL